MSDLDISIEQVEKDPIKNTETEVVERKGLGHPDTICDNIAEKGLRKTKREENSLRPRTRQIKSSVKQSPR
ncbi:hypothetical protein HRED_10297 [Candidatus Haloredivivus sp. G17]|nr:hypothetical protein HRED_10297 [Candidatus Haloredivivus sp. G17]